MADQDRNDAKAGVDAKVATFKIDLAAWMDQRSAPFDRMPAIIAMLEVAFGCYLDLMDEPDAYELAADAIRKVVAGKATLQ